MPDVIRVLIADDHAIVRKGVREVLQAQAGLEVVGDVATAEAALAEVTARRADVLVLDLSFPSMDGVEMLRRLREVAPKVVVIVLTMYPEDQMAWHILQLGAAAYLNKSRPPDELVRAIRTAVARGRYLTRRLEDLAFEHQLPEAPQEPHHRLTTREYHVFLALIAGKPVGRTALELGLSPSTVSNHVAAIRDKLGAASIADIVHYAYRAGLL